MRKEVKIENFDKFLLQDWQCRGNRLSFCFKEQKYEFEFENDGKGGILLFDIKAGLRRRVWTANDEIVVDGISFFKENLQARNSKGSALEGELRSPMPGKVLKIFVNQGDLVSAGDPIIVMEAMKMEHTMRAPRDGIVEEIFFKEGEQVPGDTELVLLKEESRSED